MFGSFRFLPTAARPSRLAGAAACLGLAGFTLAATGCAGRSTVAIEREPSLVLHLDEADTARGVEQPLPRWVERRWSGDGLLASAADGKPQPWVQVRVRGGGRTLHEGRVRLPEGALARPVATTGPLPVARLLRPSLTLSMVGRSEGDQLGHGFAQARFDAAYLAALDRLDRGSTLDQAVWLAVLGLNADDLDAYARYAAPVDAAGAIALREAGIDPARLAELDAAGARFPADALLKLNREGVRPAALVELRSQGVPARVDAMLLAHGGRAGVVEAQADDPVTRVARVPPVAPVAPVRVVATAPAPPASSLQPTSADAAPASNPRLRLPPTAAATPVRVAATPRASRVSPAAAATTPTRAPAPAPAPARPAAATAPAFAIAPAAAPAATPRPAAAPTPTTPSRSGDRPATATPTPTPVPVIRSSPRPASASLVEPTPAAAEHANTPEPAAAEPETAAASSGPPPAGVPARYADLMSRLGYATDAELQQMFSARVEPRSVRDFLDAGHNPTAEELIRVRAAGLDGADALELARVGYRFGLDDILRLRKAGVDTEYAIALVDARYPPLTADQLVDLKARGVTPEDVRAIRN